MGRNRNRNRRTNEASEDFFHMTEGSSRSNTETTITGGTRPKLLFSSSVRRIAQKTPYGTLSNHLDKKFQVDINGCMEEYEALLSKFHNVYELWSFKRRRAICELKDLVENVHKDQLAFNSTNLLFKEINVKSRSLKNMDGSNLDFFASLATLATDVIGGVTSIAQACNVDKYTKQFNEIMEKDVEYTKPLYDARSNCFSKYKDVEEIVRHYHSETFGSTLNKISNTLKVDEMLLDIRSTKSGDIIQALELFDNFFRLMSREEVFSGVCKSVVKYVDNNPAVLDACESTGKVLYDVFDTWGRDPKKNSSVVQGISFTANQAIIRREETKISNLRSIVNNEDRSQAKLESTIQKALDGLEAEIREVEKLYRDSVQLISSKKGIYNYEDSDDDHNNFHANYNSSYFS